MAFPPQFLDDIRARVDLAEVVGRHVKLSRRGREFVGLSPFQNEKTPSFTVVPEKGFYHCFSSGEHGDVIDFVMKVEGLSFPEAVERLAGLAGLQMPADSPEERARAEKRRSLYDVVEAAARHYERMLRMPEGREALAYLRRRGLDDQTISAFRLGFAPDSRAAIKGALAREDITEDALVEAGLLIRPEDGGRSLYDRFRGRVMFPITDRRGRVIAFGGRILADGQPKYLNSPETPLFHKGAVLYGLHQATRPAQDAGAVVVTEGYMDVIALHRGGIAHAVAPLGTALTEDQFALLWRLAPDAVLCFDGDVAGQRAAARAAERALPLLKPGSGLRFAVLPAGEDPDSLIARQGRGAMERVIDGAVPLSDALWRIESGGRIPSSAEGRAHLQDRLEAHARAITDTTVRSHFRRSFRERLWPKSPARRTAGGRPGWRSGVALDGRSAGAPVDMVGRREQILLATLINHPDLYDHVSERLGMLSFSAPDLDILRQQVLNILAEEQGLDSTGLQRHLKQQGFGEVIDGVLDAGVYQHAFFARPDSPAETAREGWDETHGLFTGQSLQQDIEEAKNRLAGDMTSEAFDRFLALLSDRRQGEEDEDAATSRAGRGGPTAP